MDKQAQDNRAKQLNPNNPSGGGVGNRPAGYHGNTEKETMDNKANQQNTNNAATKGGR